MRRYTFAIRAPASVPIGMLASGRSSTARPSSESSSSAHPASSAPVRSERNARTIRRRAAARRARSTPSSGSRSGRTPGGTSARIALELQQVHVEVAHVAGHLLQPAELVPEALELGRREHPAQLALDRARAPDRDPEVVEELAVEIRDRALQVGLDHVEQRAQHRRRGSVGPLRPCERNADLRRGAAGLRPGRDERLVHQRPRRGLETQVAAERTAAPA